MKLRTFIEQDISQISELYFNTVRKINFMDYSKKHTEVWASEIYTNDFWIKRFDNYLVNIVEHDQKILGFSEYQFPGHIDCFYVHHEWQRHGVGSMLLSALEKNAKTEKTKRLFADVNITAKPFFQSNGFLVVKEQNKSFQNLMFKQFFMEKWL